MNKSKRPTSSIKPTDIIDYNQTDILLSFLTEQGKIKSRYLTHLTLKQQRQLSKSIKRARMINLLPFKFNKNWIKSNKNSIKKNNTYLKK
ncbi:unnamed protein product [Choristocarpus tenellus]|uniref:30S ribosomal protein S18 n=1 Tax=Choristocarpus tenellus TaxID=116065 RepID=UPI002E791BBC|nr:30S ribosomal protein S18 [Choristocarpus tenellus]WAM62382.1 30S ribosomal protein S18 [Choristocarpus tenellus]